MRRTACSRVYGSTEATRVQSELSPENRVLNPRPARGRTGGPRRACSNGTVGVREVHLMKRKWRLVLISSTAIVAGALILLTLGPKLVHTNSRPLRWIGRNVLAVRIQMKMASGQGLLDAVKATIRGGGEDREDLVRLVRAGRKKLTAEERDLFAAGVQQLFMNSRSSGELLILSGHWREELSDQFLLSAACSGNPSARGMACALLELRHKDSSPGHLANAAGAVLANGLARSDNEMVKEGLCLGLAVAKEFVGPYRALVEGVTGSEDPYVRRLARWCLNRADRNIETKPASASRPRPNGWTGPESFYRRPSKP
jgi:hypothetical protein